jgi:hypothetical protein
MLLGMLWLLLGITGLMQDHNKNKSLIELRNLLYILLHFLHNTDTSIQYFASPY